MILHRKKAFTLVEMMISTAIFAALIGALYTVFASGKFSWASFENKVIVQREVRQALSKMNKELREASGISLNQYAGNTTLNFTKGALGTVTYQWSNTGSDANAILRTNQSATTIIAHNISLLSFTSDASSITIDITALKGLWGGAVNSYHLKQKIALR